jgi:hypothetical protein
VVIVLGCFFFSSDIFGIGFLFTYSDAWLQKEIVPLHKFQGVQYCNVNAIPPNKITNRNAWKKDR